METLYEEEMNGPQGCVRVSIEPLERKELPGMLVLQQSVCEALEDQTILQALTIEEFEFIFAGNGLMVGAYAEGELIAFRALLAPPIDAEHLGYDIGLTEDMLPRVIYQEISVVHPSYRGNRLQQKMGDVVMRQLPLLEREFRFVCATVAPGNLASLKDKLAQGMEIHALKEKYGDWLRYILVKDLEAPRKPGGERVLVEIENLDRQKQLLADGFVGVGIEERERRGLLEFLQIERSDRK
ncbi:hypothetical protein [Planomicrobium sp. YIM 101495]|uniref:hypothetical protein n=1 Tax=Planomicrobium sp. YIM 101495 TaxID=2665160 RepID=UPI0012B701C1|nr:hypothetical protein [Planomicrobium sp. YIM 101495]MTD31492.1 hypothetical protein [Planomicrobium sp. YIM 101495]